MTDDATISMVAAFVLAMKFALTAELPPEYRPIYNNSA
jgi:hypothetical protein